MAQFVKGKWKTPTMEKTGGTSSQMDELASQLYAGGYGKKDIGSALVGAGKQIGEGDWMGGLASGAAGVMDFLGTSAGRGVLAGEAGKQGGAVAQDYAPALAAQAREKEAEELQQRQAYQQLLKEQADRELAGELSMAGGDAGVDPLEVQAKLTKYYKDLGYGGTSLESMVRQAMAALAKGEPIPGGGEKTSIVDRIVRGEKDIKEPTHTKVNLPATRLAAEPPKKDQKTAQVPETTKKRVPLTKTANTSEGWRI